MPFVDNTTAFEQKYASSDEDNKYSYSSLVLNDAITDEAQIQVRYVPTTIYVGDTQADGGTARATNSLSSRILELLTVIPTTLEEITVYTVNASDDDITFNITNLQNKERQIDGVSYYYGAALSVSTTEPIVIRRATSLNDKSVSFQAGSRLTSTSLNLAVDQLFNASQELTAFGGSGGSGVSASELNLEGYSIQDLGDVSNFASPGALEWTGTGVGIAAFSNLPSSDPSDEGKYLGVNSSGAAVWSAFDIQGANVAYDGSNSVNDKINDNITNIASNDTDITNLQNKTTALSYDASTGFDFTGNITNGTGSITTNSATVGGMPVTDRFFFASKPGSDGEIRTTTITGTGSRSLIAAEDLDAVWSFYGNSEGLASYESTDTQRENNCIKIPRDMTIRCKIDFAARPTQGEKLFGGGFVAPYKNIDWTSVSYTDRTTFNSYSAGSVAFQYLYNNRTESSSSQFYDLVPTHKQWILNVSENDKLYFLFWRWGPSGSTDDDSYSDVELRYGKLYIEEIFPASFSSLSSVGTIASS